jgi:hypothetical protein
LSFQWFTIKPIFMAQLPPQKRRKRRVQLREAQRRRRARLKEESKSFLQIILDQETLRSLRAYSDSAGKPLHICAADLIRAGLSLEISNEQKGLSISFPKPLLVDEKQFSPVKQV